MNIKVIRRKFVNRETILYALSGFIKFAVSAVFFQGLVYLGINYKISNIFSIVLSKLFAYIMHKKVVFRSKNENIAEFCWEFMRYVFAQGLTGLIDYFGVVFAVEILNWDKVISKYVLTVLVIILNYFIGKKMVFKNSR